MKRLSIGGCLLLANIAGAAQPEQPFFEPSEFEPPGAAQAELTTEADASSEAQTKVFAPSAVTRNGSKLFLPDERNGLLPLVILLPFTGSSAERLLGWYYSDSLLQQAHRLSFAVLLTSATGQRSDYATPAIWSRTLDRFQDSLAADVEEAVKEYGADPGRIVLAGYSMGGDIAWATILRDPQRYAGAIVMGSRATYRRPEALEPLAAREARFFMFMGNDESKLRLAGMRAALNALTGAGIAHQYQRAPGGHLPAPPEQLSEAIRFVLKYSPDEASQK